MRARARERLDKEQLIDRVELICGDATRLPYPDGSMDAVFMSFTLELFDTPDVPQVLAECRRVLRTGGRIGVVAITKEGKDGFAVEAYEWTHQHFPNLLDCRPIFVRRALEDAGFSIRDATITNNVGARRDRRRREGIRQVRRHAQEHLLDHMELTFGKGALLLLLVAAVVAMLTAPPEAAL